MMVAQGLCILKTGRTVLSPLCLQTLAAMAFRMTGWLETKTQPFPAPRVSSPTSVSKVVNQGTTLWHQLLKQRCNTQLHV